MKIKTYIGMTWLWVKDFAIKLLAEISNSDWYVVGGLSSIVLYKAWSEDTLRGFLVLGAMLLLFIYIQLVKITDELKQANKTEALEIVSDRGSVTTSCDPGFLVPGRESHVDLNSYNHQSIKP